ncbi:uncharacterized protein LOC121413982 [Lytechinus variegatus]|uniref:uncharacterized protein LOC121413982 n=1 Tax=Lytechinus variegatus TaxID=7654 RepID=UPI001BB1D52A|nr:uncharacterized protein LOC121413982 [Lytechinus variegatus]
MNVNTPDLASKYESISSIYLQNRWHKEAFNLIDFEINDHVLDVGCGTGRECRYISPFVNSVIGIDKSRGMIEQARKTNTALHIQYLEDAAETFFDHHSDWSERFNKILCLSVLHYCKDENRILNNIFKCLKPGGSFVIGFPSKFQLHGEGSSYGETADNWVRNHERWGVFLKDYDYQIIPRENSDAFITTMKSLGFKVQYVKVHKGKYVLWKEKLIKAQLQCLFDPITQIPFQQQDEFLDDVYKWLYDVTTKREDGYLQGELGRFEYLIALATKE